MKGDWKIKVIPIWHQTDTSNAICGTQRSKLDLHRILEEMFLWSQFFKNFKIKTLLVKAYTKGAQNVLSECPQGIDI